MKQISLTLDSSNTPIRRDYVTGFRLHGLFFHALKVADPYEAERLHGSVTPKPFTIRPKFDRQYLTTLQFHSLDTKTSQLLENVWQAIYETEYPMHLGRYQLRFDRFESVAFCPSNNLTPQPEITLQFLTPTTFSQGVGYLPLPIPANVFQRPFEVWQRYHDEGQRLPDDWPAWCERNVFIKWHHTRMTRRPLTKQLSHHGFVGEVTFEVASREHANLPYVSGFVLLARLATFCGVGYRTTMGMGICKIADLVLNS